MYNLASEETYQNGQIIFKEGSSGDWVYLILSGSVQIFKTVGDKEIIIETLQPGEVFGELSYLGGIKRTTSARAVGETTLGVIDRTFLDKEFNKISADLRSIITALVRRFKKLLDRAIDFSSRAEQRFLKTLSLTYKDRDAFFKAYTGNISSGGLFIRTKNPLDKGEQFLLKLQLPDLSQPMKIKCEVVWALKEEAETEGKSAGMGIKFIEMSKSDYQILKQYLNNLMKEKE
jgi:uncharacterized protein (TIGR02266 family)